MNTGIVRLPSGDLWSPGVEAGPSNVQEGSSLARRSSEEKLQAVAQGLECVFCGFKAEKTEELKEHILKLHASGVQADEDLAKEAKDATAGGKVKGVKVKKKAGK